MTRSPKAEAKGRKLSKFLCFAVYSANLAFGRAYKPILDAVGLTYTQYIAMVALSEQGDQTVSALGEKLFLESNTLTPILKKLEASCAPFGWGDDLLPLSSSMVSQGARATNSPL